MFLVGDCAWNGVALTVNTKHERASCTYFVLIFGVLFALCGLLKFVQVMYYIYL
jgi:uncharacterized membrane protein YidH (DUF202 family)